MAGNVQLGSLMPVCSYLAEIGEVSSLRIQSLGILLCSDPFVPIIDKVEKWQVIHRQSLLLLVPAHIVASYISVVPVVIAATWAAGEPISGVAWPRLCMSPFMILVVPYRVFNWVWAKLVGTQLSRLEAVGVWDFSIIMIYLFMMAAMVYLSSGVLSREHGASGRCVKCGYDLRATPHRCPECGTVPDR